MELNADEEGMIGEFHDFGKIFAGCSSRNHHTGLLELVTVRVVHFITVTMTLADFLTVNFGSQCSGFNRNNLFA